MELKLNHQNVISSNEKALEGFGRLISAEGYTVVTRSTEALTEKIKKGLTNISELRSLLSLIGYFQRSIPNFSQTVKPLYQLFKDKELKREYQQKIE